MEVKVVRTEESTVFAPPGGAAKVYRVTFMVGEHGPFTVDLKQLDFTPTRVREEIEKIAATVRGIS